jgi:preprotein translocase subunit SecD
MYKNLRWKVLTVIAVIVMFSAVGVYPILALRYHLPAPSWLMSKQLQLGLDLKGGVHLVLRVNRDDALRLTSETMAEQVREALQSAGVTVGSIAVTSPTTIHIEGVPADKDAEFRRVADDARGTNYDRSGSGGNYDLTMRPNIVKDLREQTMVQAQETIDRRVNELGVSEPNIARHGDEENQLLVQLPGISDVARAKDIIQSTAVLELKLVEAGPAPTKEALLQSYSGKEPPDMEVVSGASDSRSGDAGTVVYLVRKVAAVTGNDLRSAQPGLDENSRPAVMFSLKPDGARKFGQVTGSNIGRRLAIILDNRVQSAPVIEGRISDNGRISGSFTQQEAADLALKLRSGALPASMTYLEERVVGPTLGADSIRSGITAALAGLLLVVIFMLVYYKLAGINAIFAMVVNLIILLGMMAYVGATMTLPGIAGFILTMGMGVDSNVLIFERIKEELAAGKGARPAINASFDRVFWTLLDTHVTSLIAAAFLFQFGTGPIRGFATTLVFGLLSNIFTSIFVSKTLFELVLSRRGINAKTVSI